MTSVATKGSCVTAMVKISAGRRGARRAQRAAALGPLGAGGVARRCSRAGGGAVSRLISASLLLAVLLGDLLREALPRVERVVHRCRPGDGGADLLRHLGSQIGEL